jgi:hypothetical protein
MFCWVPFKGLHNPFHSEAEFSHIVALPSLLWKRLLLRCDLVENSLGYAPPPPQGLLLVQGLLLATALPSYRALYLGAKPLSLSI